MQKPIVYAEIPAFDQNTQGVFQLEPVDMGDHFFVGIEIREIEVDEGENGEQI